MTREIAQAVMSAVEPLGVGVITECSHMCMVMRGVEKVGTSTVSSAMLGTFRTDRDLRREFMSLMEKR